MKTEKTPYEKQIFVCTNDAKGEKPSCGDQNGEAIFRKLRETAKERGLHPRIRVAQAKCLGKCGMGCNIMVYSQHSLTVNGVGTSPDNVWHSGVLMEHTDELIKKYLSASK